MAKDLNNGDKLTGRILEEARLEAESIANAARAEADKIKELADKEVQNIQAEYTAKSRKAAADILERSSTNARLDARKRALSARREVIDRAFDLALEKLAALDGEARDGLIKRLAVGSAYGGETLCPAQADEERAAAMLDSINAALGERGKAPLTLGGSMEIAGGFFLKGEGYEMNCSFEALLRDFRDAGESSVAKLLFG